MLHGKLMEPHGNGWTNTAGPRAADDGMKFECHGFYDRQCYEYYSGLPGHYHRMLGISSRVSVTASLLAIAGGDINLDKISSGLEERARTEKKTAGYCPAVGYLNGIDWDYAIATLSLF